MSLFETESDILKQDPKIEHAKERMEKPNWNFKCFFPFKTHINSCFAFMSTSVIRRVIRCLCLRLSGKDECFEVSNTKSFPFDSKTMKSNYILMIRCSRNNDIHILAWNAYNKNILIRVKLIFRLSFNMMVLPVLNERNSGVSTKHSGISTAFNK